MNICKQASSQGALGLAAASGGLAQEIQQKTGTLKAREVGRPQTLNASTHQKMGPQNRREQNQNGGTPKKSPSPPFIVKGGRDVTMWEAKIYFPPF